MKNLAVLSVLIVLLLQLAPPSVQAQKKSLHILKWTGVTNSVELGLIDKITFAENDLVMNYKSGTSETVEMLTIRKFAFGTTTGLFKGLKSNEKMSFYINSADILVMSNLPEGIHPIGIYTIAGVLIQTSNVCSDSPSVDLRHLDKGVYLVRVNNQLLKFVRS